MLQSRCQGRVDGTVLGVILFRLTENSVLMNEISENTWNEVLNKLFMVKNQLKSECALVESQRELESQRRQVLEASQWADQAQRERIEEPSSPGMLRKKLLRN